MSPPILEIESFSFMCGAKAILHEVSFAVSAGEYLSIVGPNGAGKTTLLRCLMRVLTGGSGLITVCGRPLQVYSQRELARLLSYVPQAGGRGGMFTAAEFVAMGRYPYLEAFTHPSAQDRDAVAEALRATGTAALAGRLLDTLSGGELQKVHIAAALAQKPKVLLLDEPTTFLDPRHEEEIHRLLRRVNREGGLTILSVTHDINSAVFMSDRLLALRQGEVAFHGPSRGFMEDGVLRRVFDRGFLLAPHPRSGEPFVVPEALS